MSGFSVVIPARDRAGVVGRAVASALAQGADAAEVLVVDDASTDDTRGVVAHLAAADGRVRLVGLDRSQGAAAARNAGIDAASRPFVAFLDSDDEWLPGHLARRRALLERSGADLAFGAFFTDDGRRRRLQPCPPLAGDPLEYLFGRGGTFRTSTFAGRAAAIRETRFDVDQRKHQDWDFMLRFLAGHAVAADPEPTAVLHVGSGDRMSARPDHAATARFVERHRARHSRTGWLLFATVMLERSFRTEGRGEHYRRYLRLAADMDPAAARTIDAMSAIMAIPGVGGRAYRAATRAYGRMTASRRAGAARASPAG